MTFPTSFPAWPIANNDLLLFADVTDGDINKKATAWAVTVAGITSANSDLLPEGTNNKYMTNGEKTKLQWIQLGAQVNSVTTVNGQSGPVELDLDDIPDGWTFVKSNQVFDNARLAQLTAANLHVSNTNNPHNVTKTQVWLANVENIAALWRAPFSFDVLTEKSNVQLHLDDYMVVQDSSISSLPLWEIKKVKNQTDLIRKAAYIQIRGQSINYYAHTFVDNTTYRLRSLVTNANNIYYCIVSHQSSGTFAADLALWRRQIIGWWGGGWASLSWGTWAPVVPWTGIGDVYVDVTNWDIYYRNGAVWTVYTAPQNFPVTSGAPVAPGSVVGETVVDPTTGIIYIWNGATRTANGAGGSGWVNYDVTPTIGSRVVFSIWTWANTIAESSMRYNPLTDTFSFIWSTIEYNDVTENYNDTPVLISCTATQLFSTAYAYPALTQFVEVVINYDAVSETIRFTPNSWSQIFTVNGQQFSVVAWVANYTYAIVTGTVWLWSITTSCHYNGVSVINQNNLITNSTWGITNNTNITVKNVWVTEVYDVTSDVTYQWDITFGWDVIITGQLIGGWETPFVMNTATHNAVVGQYILVTHAIWNSTITFPDASLFPGSKIRVKKFTNEDIFTVTITPFGAQTIDWFTSAIMNMHRTIYTFTAIGSDWYLWD